MTQAQRGACVWFLGCSLLEGLGSYWTPGSTPASLHRGVVSPFLECA